LITAMLAFLITGTPVFLYFAYSNEIGTITITGKSWTDFCNATKWTDKNICYAYFNFTANEDVFWYPINYEPFGRSTPYSFDPAVKEWKLERKWGNSWREIPLTKPCTGTWCGAKPNIPALYSVVWRKGQSYETRISAIKQNPIDNIVWNFGKDDPIWFGISIEIIQNCIIKTQEKLTAIYEDYFYYYNQTVCSDEPINLSCEIKTTNIYTLKQNIGNYIEFLNTTICETIGLNISGNEFIWQKEGWECRRNLFNITCDAPFQSNRDGICQSGERCNIYDIRDIAIKDFNKVIILGYSPTNQIKNIK